MLLLLGRVAELRTSMRTVVTNGSSVVCLSVCLSQSWALQNHWSDRDAVWIVDSGGPKETWRVRWCAHWRNLENTIELSMCGGDAAFLSYYTLLYCQYCGPISWTTCYYHYYCRPYYCRPLYWCRYINQPAVFVCLSIRSTAFEL